MTGHSILLQRYREKFGKNFLVLGSSSPRRREILDYFSLPFLQIPSEFNEESLLYEGDPVIYAQTLSLKKSEALSALFPEELILTADTIVCCEKKLYNKPRDSEEAAQFLRELSGRWHQVFTAVTLRKEDSIFTECEETRLLFHPLSSEEISRYHRHFHFLDKAGGYAIQRGGGLIVSRVEGCYYNVMGLPINTLKRLLGKMGMDLWDFLKSDL
jgi:septum formation protein